MSEGYLSEEKKQVAEQEKTQLKETIERKAAAPLPVTEELGEKQTGKTLPVTKLLGDIDDRRLQELPKESEPAASMDHGAEGFIRSLLRKENSPLTVFSARDRKLIEKLVFSQLSFLTGKGDPERLEKKEIEKMVRTVEERLVAGRKKDTTLIYDEDEDYRTYVFENIITAQTDYLSRDLYIRQRKERYNEAREVREYLDWDKRYQRKEPFERILKKPEPSDKDRKEEKPKEKRKPKVADTEAFTEKIDGRLHDLFHPAEGEDFSVFLDVLRDDDRFLLHLNSDTDEEYQAFLGKAIPAIRAIVEEFAGRLYVDQYFLERGQDLDRIIMEGRTENIGIVLGLNRLDRSFEEALIGKEKKFKLPTKKELDQMQPDQEIREDLDEAIAQPSEISEDPELEKKYQAVLKKMLFDAKNNDHESIERDLILAQRIGQAALEVAAKKKEEKEKKKKRVLPKTEQDFLDSLHAFIKKNVKKEDAKLLTVRMNNLTEEEIRLIAYFIQNSTGVAALQGAIEHVTEFDPTLYAHLQDSEATLAFIRGDGISAEMLGINYDELLRRQKTQPELFTRLLGNALVLANDCRGMRKLKRRQALEKGEEISLDPDIILEELKCARKATMIWMDELKKDQNLSTDEKLWRFYTVIRTYSDVFDRYRESERLRETGIPAGLREVYELYARLQEYFSSEERDPGTLRKIYATGFARDIGLVDLTGLKKAAADKKIEIEIKNEMTRQKIKEMTRAHITEKTGMVRKQVKTLRDQDEKNFPPETVAAVKKMDRWIVENIKRRVGDSDSNFVMELLGHSLRERLLVYYLIENEKEKMPTELDAAVAVTGYVPDVANFTDKLKKFFLLRGANILRKIDLVDESGLLNTAGKYSTKKIEGVIRLLDDPSKGLDRYLEKAVEDRKHMLDPDLPEEVRYRQLCYIALMEDVTKLRALTNGMPPEKMEKSEAVARWRTRIERSLSRLVKANEKVKALWENDKVAKKFASTTTALPWNFDGEKLKDPIRESGVWDYLSNVFNLPATLLAAKDVLEPNLSVTGRIRRAAQTLDKAGQTVSRGKYIGQIIGFFVDSPSGAVAKVIGKAMSSVATFVKTVISAGQYGMVSLSAKKATEFAENVQKEEKKKSEEQKTEEKKTEEQKTEEPKEKTPDEEPLPQVPLPDFDQAVKSTIHIQKHILRDEIATNLMRTAGSLSSIVATFIPDKMARKAVGEISDVMMVTRLLFSLWSRSDLRKKAMDEFLNLDDLTKQVTPMVETLDQQTQVKYGYYRIQTKDANLDAVKDALRMEVLRQLHFSSMEEFFSEITQRYAAVIYHHIFFDEEGKAILADNEKAIKERRPLCKLFPNLKFTYPKKPGEPPAPGIIQIGWQLSRGVT